ncbi:MAG: hypothetical protein IKS55_14025 [Oscillospiraceae bacterium]|nr:hypothetical protein [Oscillospiraceae bacterium]
MNDIVLWVPALLLSLFCLVYSLAARRELYLPLPKGISAKLRDQHSSACGMTLYSGVLYDNEEAAGRRLLRYLPDQAFCFP